MVDMKEITPVCVKDTDGMVLHRIAAHTAYVLIRILNKIHELIPAAGSRAGILHRSGIIQPLSLILSLIFGISPVQAYGFLRKLFNHFRESAYNIPPEHGAPSVLHQEFAQSLHEININPIHTLFFGCRSALAFP